MTPAALLAVAAVGLAGPVRVYRLETPIAAFAVSADGKRFAVARDGNWIDVYDADSGAACQSVRFNDPDKVMVLAFSPDGKLLAARAEGNAEVRAWDVATGEHLFAVPVPGEPSLPLAFAPDGSALYAAAADGGVVRLDPRTGGARAAVPGRPRPEGAAQTIVAHPGGRLLALLGEDGGEIRRLADGKAVRAVHSPGLGLGPAAFTPDGRSVVVAVGPNGFSVVETGTGQRRWGRSSRGDRPGGLAVSPDGRWLAASGGYRPIQVYATDRGTEAAVLGRTWSEAELATGGDRLFAASKNGRIEVWRWPPAATRPPARRLLPADRDRLRDRLHRGTPAEAAGAIAELSSAPSDAVELAREFLRPARRPDPRAEAEVRSLAADLARDEFDVREAASRKLLALAPDAGPELLRAAAGATDPEAEFRLRAVLRLKNIRPADADPAVARYLELLERVNTAAARDVVRTVAGGDPDADLTQDAADTFARMDRAARR